MKKLLLLALALPLILAAGPKPNLHGLDVTLSGTAPVYTVELSRSVNPDKLPELWVRRICDRSSVEVAVIYLANDGNRSSLGTAGKDKPFPTTGENCRAFVFLAPDRDIAVSNIVDG